MPYTDYLSSVYIELMQNRTRGEGKVKGSHVERDNE
jgi:hypothetical protein